MYLFNIRYFVQFDSTYTSAYICFLKNIYQNKYDKKYNTYSNILNSYKQITCIQRAIKSINQLLLLLTTI